MILAIESSCDEAAVALFDPHKGMVGEWIHSQIAIHERHGGVVPDLATREHLRTLGPLLKHAFGVVPASGLERIVVTHGPGLAGCLAIGLSAAKSLSVALGLPLSGINHLRGHVFSPFIRLHAEDPLAFAGEFDALLPHLGLIVSGGNTLLCEIRRDRSLKVLSSTRDDAAGEALDKGAKLLGLGYPGGPLIERQAQAGKTDAFDFPRGIGPRAELDFSFSGLKTSLRYQLEKMSPPEIQDRMADLCASYQQAVIDALIRKAACALDLADYRSVGLSGGVANNRTLRSELEKMVTRRGLAFYAAESKHTGDNAGMIAFAGWIDPSVTVTAPEALLIEPGIPVA